MGTGSGSCTLCGAGKTTENQAATMASFCGILRAFLVEALSITQFFNFLSAEMIISSQLFMIIKGNNVLKS